MHVQVCIFMCACVLSVHLWVSSGNSTLTFPIPQDLAESRSSASYLILQELTVCRYHTALQPAGSWINPKMSQPLIWVMLVWTEWSCSNPELLVIHCAHFGLLCAKNTCFQHDLAICSVFVTLSLPYNSSVDVLHSETKLLCTE